MKVYKKRNHSKSNCLPVRNKIRRLLNKGLSRDAIANELKVSASFVEDMTRHWNRTTCKAPARKRTFDYHIAYCLLFEHGLTYKEAAFALDVNERSLREIMRRNKSKIEETFPSWKIWYADLRNSWRPRNLYSRSTAAKLRHERDVESHTSNLKQDQAVREWSIAAE